MPVIAFLLAVFVVTVEQLSQWRYGPMGIVALTLLAIGIRSRNHTCSAIGAVALALLVTRPAL
ncbi:hypothetical protein [Streptomyces sp. 351MFTsu5.1]|uniref:hypothetical protein n=1 Tax=Streptomyces sp. 351MFTsu5.1 TaxID=1172180 RepID=UPI000365A2DB|nr:hypothetical protein [Streptomyces sp. 351MFTsu5.1]